MWKGWEDLLPHNDITRLLTIPVPVSNERCCLLQAMRFAIQPFTGEPDILVADQIQGKSDAPQSAD
jgi:hypothetical protein